MLLSKYIYWDLHARSLNIRKSINKIKSIEILKRIAIVIDVNVALKTCTFIFLRDTRDLLGLAEHTFIPRTM